MLDIEYEYLNKNLQTFLSKYKKKTIVIVGDKVVGVYNTFNEAYSKSIKEYKPGSFLIETFQ